jgi:hypothetical protein
MFVYIIKSSKSMKKNKYVICSLCKKRITLKSFLFFDNNEKIWWIEQDSKPYWRNKDSGNIYCDTCFNQFLWESELNLFT